MLQYFQSVFDHADIQAMMVLMVSICLTFAIALMFVTRGNSYHGLGSWVIGLLLISIVNPILMAKTVLPEVLWIPVSNLTMTATYVMLYWAILDLRQIPKSSSLGILILLVSIGINALTFQAPPLRMIANASLYITLLTLITQCLLGPKGKPVIGQGKYVFLLANLIQLLMFLDRINTGLFHPTEAVHTLFDDLTNIQAKYVLTLSFTTLLYTFALLVMALEATTQEVRELLHTDALTGAWNRRKLDETTQTLNRNQAMQPASIIMADIDHFKEINDTHGHMFGDVILKEFSITLQNALRGSDTLYRWGGEEFVVLLVGSDFQKASQIAERLRIAVENARFSAGLKITASFGYTEVDLVDDWKNTIARGDKALYQAKANGRNQIFGISAVSPIWNILSRP